MFPRFTPNYTVGDLLGLGRVFERKCVERFEESFAQALGRKHGICFPYGRTALIAILKSLGFEDKEIICPAYTCVVVPHAIVYSGNRPVFVDSASTEFNMDLKKAAKAIGPNTGALIATSIFGYPVDLDALRKIKEEHPHVVVIQDCAHSFSCEFKGEPVEDFGLASFYGLNISKIINSVFGGMVLSDDDDFTQSLRQERDRLVIKASLKQGALRSLYMVAAFFAFRPLFFGIVSFLQKRGYLDALAKYYDEAIIDMPKDYLEAIPNGCARVGISQLRRYRSIVARQRRCAGIYQAALQDDKSIELPPVVEGATYSHFVILTDRRDEMLAYVADRGVELGIIIEYSVPHMSAYSEVLEKSDFPVSLGYSTGTVNLPVYSEKLAKRVSGILLDFASSDPDNKKL